MILRRSRKIVMNKQNSQFIVTTRPSQLKDNLDTITTVSRAQFIYLVLTLVLRRPD